MSERICPGLPADWLNGWLAAVGATVAVPNLTLAWSDDPVPLATLSLPGAEDPADAIDEALLTPEEIAALPIKRSLDGYPELKQNPSVDAWRARTPLSRHSSRGWSLTSLYSDLVWSRKDGQVIEKGEFLTPAPKGLTLYQRLVALGSSPRDVAGTLDGVGERVSVNGLGFDLGRVGSLADDTENHVDPVVELLSFCALALFPVRGDGGIRARQRGWSGGRSVTGSFEWPAWSAALDSSAIDALLDLDRPAAARARLCGITGWWEVVPFRARSSSDVTRGYGSRRMDGS